MKRIGLMLALAALAPFSWAENEFLKEYDQNRNGKLSWEEVVLSGWNRATFELKDLDNDGFVSKAELQACDDWLKTPVMSGKILKAMDYNGDTVLHKDEWWWSHPEFDSFDLNEDGTLGKDELARIPKAKTLKKRAQAKK